MSCCSWAFGYLTVFSSFRVVLYLISAGDVRKSESAIEIALLGAVFEADIAHGESRAIYSKSITALVDRSGHHLTLWLFAGVTDVLIDVGTSWWFHLRAFPLVIVALNLAG